MLSCSSEFQQQAYFILFLIPEYCFILTFIIIFILLHYTYEIVVKALIICLLDRILFFATFE